MPRLLPREGKFFEYFNAHAEHAVQASIELRELLANISALDRHRRSIREHEEAADVITRHTIQLLHRTFITPLDRDEIHELITGMDDVLDLIEDVAQCVFLYDVQSVTPATHRLSEICVKCTEKLRAAVMRLDTIKDPQTVLSLCADIDRLETDADEVMHTAMAVLFREEPDAKEIIKLREIYQLLESVTDRCLDVANTIEGIVLENA